MMRDSTESKNSRASRGARAAAAASTVGLPASWHGDKLGLGESGRAKERMRQMELDAS